jgi:hypothetical protein
MRQFTPRQIMAPAVVAVTLVHLGIRLNGRGDAQPVDVSQLEPGTVVSLAGLVEQRSASLQPCLQIVVFSPECPYCQRAADRESDVLSENSRQDRLWYTAAETSLLPYFVSEHLHRAPGISEQLVKELKIQGVPALFLLSPEGEIRWVGGYKGDETDQELNDRCTAARNPEQRT